MNRIVKKWSALLLAAIMLLSMAACGNNDAQSGGEPQNGAQTGGDVQNGETQTGGDVQTVEIDPQIHFCGSSSLAPVIASIGAAFQDEYGTWDKVNAAFPAEEIDIAVTSGGSGDGPQSVLDGTADFGMLARSVKDGEKESLGAGYTEYMVAYDALTISVNKNNPICGLMDDLDTDTIRKIFSGEIAYWDELDASLEHKEIVVVIRDLSGGAAEVFEKNVMQGTRMNTPSATPATACTTRTWRACTPSRSTAPSPPRKTSSTAATPSSARCCSSSTALWTAPSRPLWTTSSLTRAARSWWKTVIFPPSKQSYSPGARCSAPRLSFYPLHRQVFVVF